jgi:hypothetical protein
VGQYGLTRLTNGSSGVLFYNNPILSETTAAGTSNTHWRNNLILGENSAPAIFNITTFTNYSSSDYNGFRPNEGAEFSFQWSSPPSGVRADYTDPTRAGPSSRPADLRRWPITAGRDRDGRSRFRDCLAPGS